MGQINFKNFSFPANCINVNSPTFSNIELEPKANPKSRIHQSNYLLKPLSSYKLSSPLSKLSFVTYNVWFQWQNEKSRVPCLLKLLQTSQADFICLQQVTSEFMKAVLSCPFIEQKYFMSGFPMEGYDCLIFSKLQCVFYRYHYKRTGMGRSLLVAETEVDGQTIAVATSHFESLNNADIRKEQLGVAFDVLGKYDTALLMGDFNFDSSWNNEEKVIPKQFRDIWMEIKGKPLETMPQTNSFKAWRPDRILIKSQNWKPLAIQRIGDFTIPPYEHQQASRIAYDGVVRTPSDHFGLTCLIGK